MSPTAEADAPPQTLGHMFPIGQLVPSKLNPRKKFDDASLADLASNIQKRGEVIVPLILRTKGEKFEIIDGERRFRASKKAGITELPAILKDDLTDSEVIEIMLLSAIQRQELTPLEEASGYKALIDSNPSHYSALYIADRIGRSEKYVWDTIKLLDLVDEAKALLERDKIQVGHARVIAKHKAEDQQRIIARETGGLFQAMSRLGFDEEAEKNDPYHSLKAVTVAELQQWIKDHVRFDVQHAATAAPLDFGAVAERVEQAEAKPGKGKKVVSITYDSFVQPSAKADGEKTFGPRSWKRADGTKATTIIEYPKRKVMDSPTCDHAVLGTVVVGDGWGESFEVCIAKDKCEVHWGAEIREREKNQKLRASGKGSQAAQRESSADDGWKKEEAAREAKRALWKAICEPLVLEAIRQVKGVAKLTARHISYIEKKGIGQFDAKVATKDLGKPWHKNIPAALLASAVSNVNSYWGSFEEYVRDIAKPLGLDVKALDAVRAKHTPKPKGEAKPETKAAPKPTAKKSAKKAKARK